MTPSGTVWNMVKTETKPFYDFGSILGIPILYIIIAGVALICLLCCSIIICYKVKRKTKSSKSMKTSNNHKNTNNDTKFRKVYSDTSKATTRHNSSSNHTTIEMTNGMDMELNWKYSVKGQRVDPSSYKSSLAKNGSHKTLPTIDTEDNDAIFDRIINDRKTTITHNPLQKSVHSSSNHLTQNQTPSSYPYNSAAGVGVGIGAIAGTGSSPNSYPNTSPYPSPIVDSNPHSTEQVFSGTDTNDSSIDSKTRDESMDTVKEYAVVDTLTAIVNAAKAKENTNHKDHKHVLSLNKLHVSQHSNNNVSMQSIEFDMEPSPSPQPSMMNMNHD